MDVRVTDEVSGREVAASLAEYVRSTVVTTPTTGNRVHVFAERAAAERYAEETRGVVLEGEDRPLTR